MTQYLLSVYMIEGGPVLSDDEMQQIYADVDRLNDEIRTAGVWVFGGGLHPADTSTVASVRNGEVVLTDGPFAESKEHIGGFWIIEATDLDAALAWAKKATVACAGAVEVRPFQDNPEG